jgi:hypothetical protein
MRKLALFAAVLLFVLLSASLAGAADGTEKDTLGVALRGYALTPQGAPFLSFDSQDPQTIKVPQGSILLVYIDPVPSDAMKSYELSLGLNDQVARCADGKLAITTGWQRFAPIMGSNSFVVWGVLKGANRASAPFITIPIINYGVGHNVERTDFKSATRFVVEVAGYDGPLDARSMARYAKVDLASGGTQSVDISAPVTVKAPSGPPPPALATVDDLNKVAAQANVTAEAVEKVSADVAALGQRSDQAVSVTKCPEWKTAVIHFWDCVGDEKRIAAWFNGGFDIGHYIQCDGETKWASLVTGKVEGGQASFAWWKTGEKVVVRYHRGIKVFETPEVTLEDKGTLDITWTPTPDLPRATVSQDEMRRALCRDSVSGLLAQLRVNPVAFRQALNSCQLREGWVCTKDAYWLAYNQPAVRDLWLPTSQWPAWIMDVCGVEVFCQQIVGGNLTLAVKTSSPEPLKPILGERQDVTVTDQPGVEIPVVQLPRLQPAVAQPVIPFQVPTMTGVIGFPSTVRELERHNESNPVAQGIVIPIGIELLVCPFCHGQNGQHSPFCPLGGQPGVTPDPGFVFQAPREDPTGLEDGGGGSTTTGPGSQSGRIGGTTAPNSKAVLGTATHKTWSAPRR